MRRYSEIVILAHLAVLVITRTVVIAYEFKEGPFEKTSDRLHNGHFNQS